jgi:hypothetical protein
MEITADEIKGLKISIEEPPHIPGPPASENQAEITLLRAGLAAVSKVLAEKMAQVRVHCPKCGTLLARSGRCGRCG